MTKTARTVAIIDRFADEWITAGGGMPHEHFARCAWNDTPSRDRSDLFDGFGDFYVALYLRCERIREAA